MTNTKDSATTATATQTAQKAADKPQPARKVTARKTRAKAATATAKAPARKVNAKRSDKPAAGNVKAQQAKEIKDAVAAAKIKMIEAFGSEDKRSPYSVFLDHEAFAAYTNAAFIACGMAKMSAKGTVTRSAGSSRLWRSIVGKTAAGYWKRQGWLKDGQLTAEGQTHLQARINGESRGYKTNPELVAKFAAAMANGGTVEHAGKKFKFSVKHAVAA